MIPDQLSRPLRAFQESRILLTALELDLFSALAGGATAAQVAARCQTDAAATARLLNALVALSFLSKDAGRYENGPLTARFLCAGAAEDSRDALKHHLSLWRQWSTLTEAVRSGQAVAPTEMASRGDSWTVPFIAAMHSNAAQRAPQVVRAVGAAGVRRLLDVGGGSGAYAIAFAEANPSLRAEVFDLASVLPIAQGHIARAGLADRVTTRVGDLRRDDFGSGYDLALLSSICHMLGPDENRDLLRRLCRALDPGGRVVISDFILDPDGTTPRQAALFAINMLVGTPSGNTYTEDEYAGWLTETGFASIERLPLGGPADLIVGRRAAS